MDMKIALLITALVLAGCIFPETGAQVTQSGNTFTATLDAGNTMQYTDTDSDGKIDEIAADMTGDGIADMFYYDTDRDGKTDAWKSLQNGVTTLAWDLDGDGVPDVYDIDGDGIRDGWDLNGDLFLEQRDVDNDGVIDLHDDDFDKVYDELQ